MRWNVVEEVYVTAQAVLLLLARSQDLFMSIIKCSECFLANVLW